MFIAIVLPSSVSCVRIDRLDEYSIPHNDRDFKINFEDTANTSDAARGCSKSIINSVFSVTPFKSLPNAVSRAWHRRHKDYSRLKSCPELFTYRITERQPTFWKGTTAPITLMNDGLYTMHAPPARYKMILKPWVFQAILDKKPPCSRVGSFYSIQNILHMSTINSNPIKMLCPH